MHSEGVASSTQTSPRITGSHPPFTVRKKASTIHIFLFDNNL